MKSHNIAAQTTPRARKIAGLAMNRPNVVATVHTPAGLRIASKLDSDDVDVVEFRLDALADRVDEIERILSVLKVPALLTARHPAEGGVNHLPLVTRRSLLLRLLPLASLVDVELRSVKSLAGVISVAKSRGVRVVVSDHHFKRTPSLTDLLKRERAAFHAGADIFKLATNTTKVRDFTTLLDFISQKNKHPRAVMGMGIFGKVSRLAMAKAGSILNYGYLDQPNAPGQWEARELKKLILQA